VAATWTYSDWVTYDPGSSTRLSRLRLHIQEVSDRISQGSFSTEGKSHDYAYLESYLKQLHDKESEEAAIAAGSTGARSVTFTRGKPIYPGGASL